MDPAEYEDLAAQLRGLLIRLYDRLSGTDATLIGEFIDVGVLGLALEQMDDQLSECDQPLASDERADMLVLVELMQMDGRVLCALAWCPGK